MSKFGPKAQEKVAKSMNEFKHGDLNDSHGNKVTDRKQAIAIGFDEARREGGKVPKQ